MSFVGRKENLLGDRKNENKPTNSFETVKEGFYQDEEEEKRIYNDWLAEHFWIS